MAAVVFGLAVPALVVVALGVLALWTWRVPLAAEGNGSAMVDAIVLPNLAMARAGNHDMPVVAQLADSLSFCVGEGPDRYLSDALRTRVASARREPFVWMSLAHNAFRPTQWYYLLDDLVAAAPRLVVIGVNLRAFMPWYVASEAFYFRPLSRRLSWARTAAAAGDLAHQDVSVFDPSIYRAEERTGLLYVVAGARERARGILAFATRGLEARLGLETPIADAVDRFRFDAERARREYAVDQAGHAEARMLRRVLDELHARGIPVLVFVSPLNVERIRSAGVWDALGIPKRLESLRLAVGAAPEEWVDLHDRVPGEDFFDAINHMRVPGCTAVADALAPVVARRLAGGKPSPR